MGSYLSRPGNSTPAAVVRASPSFAPGTERPAKRPRAASDAGGGPAPALPRNDPDRGTRDLEAPVRAEHVLRVARGSDGALHIDTGGTPLYQESFLERLSLSASVLVAPLEDLQPEKPRSAGGDGKDDGSGVGSRRGKWSVPAGHVAQRNFLSFELRRALRKKQVTTPRADEVLRALRKGPSDGAVERVGALGDRERRRAVDVRGKLILAPLTTNGNLPFRQVCKGLGVDITVGEMALAEKLLQGHNSEWALLRRHKCEDVFGVQLAGSNEGVLARAAEVVSRECDVDFIDLNAGCPIDLIYNRGAGCSLMSRATKFSRVVAAMSTVIDVPFSVKIRMGVDASHLNAHTLTPKLALSGAAWVTCHGRTRTQRYSRSADWAYLRDCVAPAARSAGVPLVGNGDVYTWQDAAPYLAGGEHSDAGIDGLMLARGALIKPWLATEIKERRDWDISSSERLEIYRDFCRFGLDHWGGDERGVETTRRFFLEFLSFTHRYVPVGLLETGHAPVTMTHRSPALRGRNDLETLFASQRSSDWVKISEMMLGPVPDAFSFTPKHRSNAWAETDANG